MNSSNNKTIKERMHDEAVSRLKMYGVLPEVIHAFNSDGKKYCSKTFRVKVNTILPCRVVKITPLDSEPEYELAVKEAEEKYDILVYHVIVTQTEFGKLLTCMYVSDGPKEWGEDRHDMGYDEKIGRCDGYPYCYVINLDDPLCSEFGSCGILSYDGGLERYA